jgi:hypothetical protein
MKYACLVYTDPANSPSITDEVMDQMVKECGSWVDELEKNGKHVFSSGLQSITTATTLRNRNGEIVVTDGPFAETKEHLGGITVLEARDLNDAILQAMKLAAHCGGTVEVRPALDPFGELTDPMDIKCAAAIRRSIKEETTV